MQMIDARELDHKAINQKLREAGDVCALQGCCGQRFIAAGMADKALTIEGVPGNALGAYLNGASITVCGNAQDAVGDTMNAGEIVVHGSIGDAAGYAMRGGRIFIRDSAGYRAGIHMKAYKDQNPADGHRRRGGSFLGEYQAGGVIAVLGLHTDGRPLVGNFPCTGMHGGKLFLRGSARTSASPVRFGSRPPETRNGRRSNGIRRNSASGSASTNHAYSTRPLPSSRPTAKIRISKCTLQTDRKRGRI
ncbi:MAG: glutamate synthase [Acutalibacteraceae bacterium]